MLCIHERRGSVSKPHQLKTHKCLNTCGRVGETVLEIHEVGRAAAAAGRATLCWSTFWAQPLRESASATNPTIYSPQSKSKEEAPSQGPEEALALALGEAEPGSVGLQR